MLLNVFVSAPLKTVQLLVLRDRDGFTTDQEDDDQDYDARTNTRMDIYSFKTVPSSSERGTCLQSHVKLPCSETGR